MKQVILWIIVIVILQACTTTKPTEKVKTTTVPSKNENLDEHKNIQKIALIVGVSDYAGERNDLNGIYKDVNNMKKLFAQLGFKTVVLYNSDSINIVKYLNKYEKNLSSKDFFTFYYSGHGSHVEDISGDEKDGQDETLVLSDGTVNISLVDDTLDRSFAHIKARKLMIFDSCHSGTASKALNGKTQSKTISSKAITMSFPILEGEVGYEELKNSGEYIVLSSSQDNEESLATPKGSLFTTSFCEAVLDEDKKLKSFNELIKLVTNKIMIHCNKEKSIPHHPQIASSKSSLKDSNIQNYLSSKSN